MKITMSRSTVAGIACVLLFAATGLAGRAVAAQKHEAVGEPFSFTELGPAHLEPLGGGRVGVQWEASGTMPLKEDDNRDGDFDDPGERRLVDVWEHAYYVFTFQGDSRDGLADVRGRAAVIVTGLRGPGTTNRFKGIVEGAADCIAGRCMVDTTLGGHGPGGGSIEHLTENGVFDLDVAEWVVLRANNDPVLQWNDILLDA